MQNVVTDSEEENKQKRKKATFEKYYIPCFLYNIELPLNSYLSSI